MVMNESVFKFSSYKAFMHTKLRKDSQRGSLSRAAEALNCQRSFLSRIMNSKMQLTPDLAFKLCQHWGLKTQEAEYFKLLVEHERAIDPQYALHLSQKIKGLKNDYESIANRTSRPAPTVTHEVLYFSAWHWSAIHFLTAIKDYQSAEALADRLKLPKSLVLECLVQLSKWGFVEKVHSRWVYKGGEYHLPRESPLAILNQQNWRMRAQMDAQSLNQKSIHYTNVHTISRSNIPVLNDLILKFISEADELLKSSSEEDCIVLCCDFFGV
jgi:uncharacterized protein (TIGR02147 family)